MEFWLICLGILTYSCQNTSQDSGEKIIVEVNKNMPRCLGGMENCVHISQVTGIVEGDNPPIGQMAAPGAATEVDLKVANLIVPQIPNGACLQLGIGGMPNAFKPFPFRTLSMIVKESSLSSPLSIR